MKCRICNKPAALQPGEGAPLYKLTCDCSTKLPTTDEEIQAFADAGFCDFAVLDPVEPNGNGIPVCDIVPLKDGGVARYRNGKVARFRTAADELVAREILEGTKKLEA